MRIANRLMGSRWFLLFGVGALAVTALGSGLHVVLRPELPLSCRLTSVAEMMVRAGGKGCRSRFLR